VINIAERLVLSINNASILYNIAYCKLLDNTHLKLATQALAAAGVSAQRKDSFF